MNVVPDVRYKVLFDGAMAVSTVFSLANVFAFVFSFAWKRCVVYFVTGFSVIL